MMPVFLSESAVNENNSVCEFRRQSRIFIFLFLFLFYLLRWSFFFLTRIQPVSWQTTVYRIRCLYGTLKHISSTIWESHSTCGSFINSFLWLICCNHMPFFLIQSRYQFRALPTLSSRQRNTNPVLPKDWLRPEEERFKYLNLYILIDSWLFLNWDRSCAHAFFLSDICLENGCCNILLIEGMI